MKKSTSLIYLVGFILLMAVGSIINIGDVKTSAEAAAAAGYKSAASEFGAKYVANFTARYDIVNLNGLIGKALGIREMNGALKLEDGSLVAPNYDRPWTGTRALMLAEFKSDLEEEGIPVWYVQYPSEICKYDTEPILSTEHTNETADMFVSEAAELGVDVLDLRESLHEEGIDHYEAFFKTDHHWTIETAFWAARGLTDFIGERLDVSVPEEYLTLDVYDCEVLEDSVLGSNGRKTGIGYAGLDSLELYTPRFDTDYVVNYEGKLKTGTFGEVILDRSFLEGNSLYEMNQYNVYIGNDCGYMEIHNDEAPVDMKLFIVKDSFSRPVIAFLSTVYSDIYAVDTRSYDATLNSGLSIRDYAVSLGVDAVLVAYNPAMLTMDENFDFYGEMQ